MRAFLPAIFLLVGCATAPIKLSDVTGYYSSVTGFTAPRSLHLTRDGTFSYVQYTRELQEAVDGSIGFEAWRYTGRWQFFPPDRIEMMPTGAPKIELFVRRSEKYELVVLEPHLFPDTLSTWSTDTGPYSYRLLRKRKQPDKAREPTTSAAAPEARRP